jgi:hypothetical protein
MCRDSFQFCACESFLFWEEKWIVVLIILLQEDEDLCAGTE